MKTTTQTAARKPARSVSLRQRAAAHKAWATRRHAEMVELQDGIEEQLEAMALGLA